MNLASLLPIFKFRVQGESMSPTFKNGDKVLVNRFSYLLGKPKAGDIIVFKSDNKNIIKRIKKTEGDKSFVVGDKSGDFGWILKKDIIGKVIYNL